MTDRDLLEQYAGGSQQAFTELVRRHIDWMYASAHRQVRDAHLAEDVTQAAFVVLAQKARKLHGHATLSPWLFQVVRHISQAAIKQEIRRKHRERKAAAMTSQTTEALSRDTWSDLEPVLDELVARFRTRDRQAVLLRFYEHKSFAEVGQAMGCSEEAARKRVGRAIESLRARMGRKGIMIGAGALTSMLAVEISQPAPASLVATAGARTAASATTVSAAGIASLAKEGLTMLVMAKLKLAMLACAAVLIVGAGAGVPLVGLLSAERPVVKAGSATTNVSGTETVLITVLDKQAAPVAGAQVYLRRSIFPADWLGQPEKLVQTRLGPVLTDAAGVAKVEGVPVAKKEEQWPLEVCARVPGKLVGVATVYPSDGAVKVTLVPSHEVSGKLSVPAGFRPRDVRVHLLVMDVKDGSPGLAMLSVDELSVDQGWPELFDYPVAEDGSFTVRDVPVDGTIYLAGNGSGLGEAQFMTNPLKPDAVATLDIKKEGIIEGIVTYEGTGAPAADARLEARPSHRASGLPVAHAYRGRTDKEGHFRIVDLPDHIYTLAVLNEQSVRRVPEWTTANRDNVRVAAGETVKDLKLELEKGAIVTGKVVDPRTGKGIANVNVSAENPAQPDGSFIASTMTDADGRYTLRLPTGSSTLYLSSVPDGYDYPARSQEDKKVTIAKGEHVKPGPTFKPRIANLAMDDTGVAVLRGRVVDESGKGLKGIHIGDETVERMGSEDVTVIPPVVATTDAEGNFQVKVAAGVKHALFVSDPDWASQKRKPIIPKKDATVDAGDLVVHPHPVIAQISGTVVDDKGRPLAGAEIGMRSDLLTDADGKFSLPLRKVDKPVMLLIGKTGFTYRNWNDVPPNAKDLTFILYPTDRAGYSFGERQPPNARDSVDKPAPALDVGKWVILPDGKPPILGNGRWTMLLFDWNCDEPQAVLRDQRQFEAEVNRAGVQGVVIFSPQSHESGIRFALGQHKPTVAIATDRYLVNSPFSITGATLSRFGMEGMPQAFIISPEGIVRHAQKGSAKLAEIIVQLQ